MALRNMKLRKPFAILMALVVLLFSACDGGVDDSRPAEQPPTEVDVLPDWLTGNFTGTMSYFGLFEFDIYLHAESTSFTVFITVDGLPAPTTVMDSDDPNVTFTLDGSGARLTATMVDPEFPDDQPLEMVFTRSGDNVILEMPQGGTVMDSNLHPTSDPVPNPVRQVVIDQKDPYDYIYVEPGKQIQLTYTAYPEDAEPLEFKWDVYDSFNYGDINEDTGLYTPTDREGETSIHLMTAIGERGIYDEAHIILTDPIESVGIRVEEGKTILYPGEMCRLRVYVDGGLYNYTTWKNSDPEIIDLSFRFEYDTQYIDVVGLAPGEAYITANVRGVDSEPFKITVAGADEVKLDVSSKSVNVGEEFTISATVSPDNGFDKSNLVWESDNPDVATVDDNGVVTAYREGTANITASAYGTVSSPCVVTVSDPYVNLGTSAFEPPQWAKGLFESETPMAFLLGGLVNDYIETDLMVRIGNSIEFLTDAENAWYDVFPTGGREELIGIRSQQRNAWNWVVTYSYYEDRDTNHEVEEKLWITRTESGIDLTIENTLGEVEVYSLTRVQDQNLRVLSFADRVAIQAGFYVLGFLTDGVQEDQWVLPDISGITQTSNPNGYSLRNVPIYYDNETRSLVNGRTYFDSNYNLYLDVDVDGHSVKVDGLNMDSAMEDIKSFLTVNYDGQDIMCLFLAGIY